MARDPAPPDFSIFAAVGRHPPRPSIRFEPKELTVQLHHLQGNHAVEADVAATTATGTTAAVLARAPFRSTVVGVYVIPTANVTGHTTDNATITVLNKGDDGDGTTVVASLALADGVAMTDFNEAAVTLSTTAASLDLDEGDVLSFGVAKGGAGLVIPALKAGVIFKAR